MLETLADMYPEADFFALFVDEQFVPDRLRGRKITTSFLDRIPGAKYVYRQLLPLYPWAVECLDLSGYGLVISADGAATKGVLTDQDTLHLCYCHSPPHSLWDQHAAYRRAMPWWERAAFVPVAQQLRQWDFAAAQRVDGFIANSRYVAQRILKYYRRESTVIYPPVNTAAAYIPEKCCDHDQGEYYLSVGRLVGAKRVDLLVAACNHLSRKLRIVGTGPEERALQDAAGPSVEFLGRLDDSALKKEYAGCRALLFAAEEDFGIVSVEAQSYGRPVIAYGRGGSLETIVGLGQEGPWRGTRDDAATGVFFDEQSEESLISAIVHFEALEARFDPQQIRGHASRFDTRIFVDAMHRYVEGQLEIHKRARAGCIPLQAVYAKSETGLRLRDVSDADRAAGK